MIRAEGVSVTLESFCLEGVDLEVEKGQSFFLLGPSGSGKTLVLETLLGIHRPRSGCVLLDGVDATDRPPEERGIGYVPQDLALFPHLSVRQNILFGLSARGRLPAGADDRLRHWVQLLDLGSVVDRRDVSTLSGGERQRVALARALVTEPSVLFMDEPFSALDASQRRRLQIEFRDLQRTLGLTLVQVTHDPEEAFLMADSMAILMDGRIQQRGRPEELYNRPANLRVARFLMLQNLYEGTAGRQTPEGYLEVTLAAGARVLVSATERPCEQGDRVVVGVRPEEVILLRPDRPPEPGRQRNLLQGVVKGWSDLGHYRLVRLRAGAMELDSWLSIRAAREFPMDAGMEVWFHIRPWSFCLLPPEE